MGRETSLVGVVLAGRYQVGGLIAPGGMSRVYRGIDTRLDRPVAIKVLDPRLTADPRFRRRFEREARAIARLHDPGVVAVYDQGETTDTIPPVVFLVLELVEGGTLRELLDQRGALHPNEAIAVLEPMLSALANAHRLGVAHRDIKPENVLISQAGALKIADFRLATAAAHTRLTVAGMVIGTPGYLAPEQISTGAADVRCDVYACGVVLFEMLTATRPFPTESPLAITHRQLNEDVPPPSTRAPAVPTRLDTLVRLATQRDPTRRLPDAQAFLAATRQARTELGIPTQPVPALQLELTHRVTVPLPDNPPQSRGRTAGNDDPTSNPATDPTTESSARLRGSPSPRFRPLRGTRMLTMPHSRAIAGGGGRHPNRHDWLIPRPALTACVIVLAATALITLVWRSAAARLATTPSLVGLGLPAAQHLLTDAHLSAVIAQRHDNTTPAGTVIATQPGASVRLPPGSTVTVTLSAGRPTVPPISPGTTLPEAQRLIRDADLTPQSGTVPGLYHPTAPAGTIIGTTPPAGTPLPIAATVTLLLSQGPPPRPTTPRHAIDSPLAGLIGNLIPR